jgi:hypothetical protein
MNDTSTATETNGTTKEKTMSTETTPATDGKGKKTKKAKTNGTGLMKLEKLQRAPSRSVQETFRATPEEHNALVAEASKGGYGSMSDFYRKKLGLD